MSVGGRCVGTHLFAGEGGAEPTASILSRPRTTDTHFESGRDAARPYRGVASTTMTQSSTDGGSNVNVALAIWCCCSRDHSPVCGSKRRDWIFFKSAGSLTVTES